MPAVCAYCAVPPEVCDAYWLGFVWVGASWRSLVPRVSETAGEAPTLWWLWLPPPYSSSIPVSRATGWGSGPSSASASLAPAFLLTLIPLVAAAASLCCWRRCARSSLGFFPAVCRYEAGTTTCTQWMLPPFWPPMRALSSCRSLWPSVGGARMRGIRTGFSAVGGFCAARLASSVPLCSATPLLWWLDSG